MACAASVMALLYGDCSVLASTLELCCSPESAAHVAFSIPAMGVLAACAAHSHCGHGRARQGNSPVYASCMFARRLTSAVAAAVHAGSAARVAFQRCCAVGML